MRQRVRGVKQFIFNHRLIKAIEVGGLPPHIFQHVKELTRPTALQGPGQHMAMAVRRSFRFEKMIEECYRHAIVMSATGSGHRHGKNDLNVT